MNPRNRARNAVFCAFGIALLAGFAWPAAAQDARSYPDKPVRIFVPYGAGGVGDLTMRLLAQKLSENTGQQFVIENRPGAGGSLSARGALSAPADGYSLAVTGNGTGDQHDAVQEPHLRRAHRLHAGLGHRHVRNAARREAGLAVQESPGPAGLRTQESRQAQSRRHQSRQHAKPVRPSVQADDRCATSPSSRTRPRRNWSPACCAATSTSAFDFYAGFQGAIADKQAPRSSRRRASSAIRCSRTCRPRSKAACRIMS